MTNEIAILKRRGSRERGGGWRRQGRWVFYDPGFLLNTLQISTLEPIRCTTFIFSLSLLRELRHREVERLAQSHTGGKRFIQNLFLGTLNHHYITEQIVNCESVPIKTFSYFRIQLVALCTDLLRTFQASCSYLLLMATFGRFIQCGIYPMSVYCTLCLLYSTYMLDPLYTPASHDPPPNPALCYDYWTFTSTIHFFKQHQKHIFQVSYIMTAHLWVLVDCNHCWARCPHLRLLLLLSGGGDYLGCMRNPFIQHTFINHPLCGQKVQWQLGNRRWGRGLWALPPSPSHPPLPGHNTSLLSNILAPWNQERSIKNISTPTGFLLPSRRHAVRAAGN